MALDDWTSTVRRAEDVEGEQHSIGEGGGLLLTGKIQPINLAGVTPLMEGRGGLIVFQALHYRVVDHHLLVLQFDAHYSEGVVGSVVVDVDAAEALLPRLDGHPLLTGIVVDHH